MRTGFLFCSLSRAQRGISGADTRLVHWTGFSLQETPAGLPAPRRRGSRCCPGDRLKGAMHRTRIALALSLLSIAFVASAQEHQHGATATVTTTTSTTTVTKVLVGTNVTFTSSPGEGSGYLSVPAGAGKHQIGRASCMERR